MTNSNQKGKRGEREAARELLRAFPLIEARRSQQYCGVKGDSDLVSNLDLQIEVKRCQQSNVHRWVEKARETGCAIVMHRKNNERWLVTIDLEDLPAVVDELYVRLGVTP